MIYLPVDSSQLGPSKGQVTVRAKFILVHQTMERTVHRFDLVLFIFHIHLIEHILSIKVKMTRRLPQFNVSNMWGIHDIITVGNVSILPKVLDDASDFGTFGVPKDKAASCVLLRLQLRLRQAKTNEIRSEQNRHSTSH